MLGIVKNLAKSVDEVLKLQIYEPNKNLKLITQVFVIVAEISLTSLMMDDNINPFWIALVCNFSSRLYCFMTMHFQISKITKKYIQ